MKNICRAGEVTLLPITLPAEARLEEETNNYVVAHSETGHHHVLTLPDLSKVKIFTHLGDRYLEIPTEGSLWHQKTGNYVHKTHKVIPGVYKIIIKKEFNYFDKAIRAVRD